MEIKAMFTYSIVRGRTLWLLINKQSFLLIFALKVGGSREKWVRQPRQQDADLQARAH